MAFVDESFRRRHRHNDNLYLLVAVLIPRDASDEAARAVRQLLLSGQRRFHWRDERRARRHDMIDTLAKLRPLDVIAFAFCARALTGKKQHQARVKCLWNLLSHLQQHGVSQVVFESRQEALNARDRREIISAQHAGVASAELLYRFDLPMEEPLLWIPDALCGAVGTHLAGGDDQFWQRLPEGLCTIEWVHK